LERVVDHIDYDLQDGVVTLTLNRPEKMNALGADSLDQFIALLDRVRDDGAARAMVLTGRGRAFCAGADLSAGDGDADGPADLGMELERTHNIVVARLRHLPVPVVCAVNGAAAGGGCGYALAGDIVIAASSAYFLQPFANIGLVPDVGATWLLPRLVGKARATGMMMLAERISAGRAEQWGMIWQVVDDDALMDTAYAIARKLAAGPTVAYGLMRAGIATSLEMSQAESLALEARNQRIAGRTNDHAEGVSAFLAKRSPVFRGD
jgi:2-(1,2-epoxy-1,2-dihydrophenyl)acetyl-CoA isomerase